jgi:hypothetical protein
MTNWADPATKPVNAYGSKARIGQSKSMYSDWRRTVGHQCYANDIDYIEWRGTGDRDASPHVVAVVETTGYDVASDYVPVYCQKVLDRFLRRDAQYRITRFVADRLGVPAYYVFVRKDLQRFRVFGLTDGSWNEFSADEYTWWLRRL